MLTSELQRMESVLWPNGPRRDVWAIVDGARDRKVFSFLVNSYLEYSCLYAGELPPELELAAPYLVQLEQDDRYSRQLIEDGWGNSWSVFLKCDSRMQVLRRHLRGLLLVRTQAGRRLAFRYFVPRVLRIYLPSCSSDELRTFYGPVATFWTENERADGLTDFRLSRKGLEQQAIGLARA